LKIKNWHRRIAASFVAAGLWLPATSYALNIPLQDSSFESFVVPALGYAYSNEYRPDSPWVDDLDSPVGFHQDDGESSWLYNAAYAENPTNSRRGSPRSGFQAMHGRANYSAQETSAVFEAGRTYAFSLWAQNDEVLDNGNGVFMYIFDGTAPFSDAASLAVALVTSINQRLDGMTAAKSQANWSQISVSHTVAPGAPEIGHPIGVGFFARLDSAVDDASLTLVPPEADFDGDDDIDGADFLLWQRGLGLDARDHFLNGGLGDGDSAVDDGDLAVWITQFGSSGSTLAQQVPESGGVLWAALAAAAVARRESQRGLA
jgi:hypothetical protein